MPLKRTPPITRRAESSPTACTLPADAGKAGAGPLLQFPLVTPLQHAGSDSALDNINTRIKRKYVSEEANSMQNFMDDMKTMFMSFSEKQDLKLSSIHKAVADIREQNAEISKAIEFLSSKYDEMREELDQIKTERNETQNYIGMLENRLELQERKARSNEIEIRNVPKFSQVESKKDLLGTVRKICEAIGVNTSETEVKDLYRTNTKNDINKPIMVELVTATKKESILSAYKNFNKQHPSNQLSTKQATINDQDNRIYISESLTFKTKKLFRQARDFAARHHFRFCWTSHGAVYLRRDEGLPFYRVASERDLESIKPADN